MSPSMPATTSGAPQRAQPPRAPFARARVAALIICFLALATAAAGSLSLAMAQVRTIRYPRPSIAITQGDGATGQVDTPLTFQVAAQAGSQLTYQWSFGDGGTSATDQATTVSHTYSTYGKETVTVTARDPLGQTAAAQTTVQVRPVPPVAKFTARVASSYTFFYFQVCIQLDATVSTGAQLTYAWDFDGGNAYGSAQDPQPQVCYSSPGKRRVTLTVTDVAGQTSSISHTIAIHA